jgi:hypothetical protein
MTHEEIIRQSLKSPSGQHTLAQSMIPSIKKVIEIAYPDSKIVWDKKEHHLTICSIPMISLSKLKDDPLNEIKKAKSQIEHALISQIKELEIDLDKKALNLTIEPCSDHLTLEIGFVGSLEYETEKE